MKNMLNLVLALALVGCASTPSPRAQAAARAKSFISALKAYHHDTGDYPQQLEELRPKYVRTDTLIYDYSDLKHLWRLIYHRIDRDNYSLELYASPCSVVQFDRNGKVMAGYGPNFTYHIGSSAYSGGDGSAGDRAVIIHANRERAGVEDEYQWVGHQFPGYRKAQRYACNETNIVGHAYDRFDVVAANGQRHFVLFDIGAFHWK